ncbi:hypothetical protein [Brevundimonas sp.]
MIKAAMTLGLIGLGSCTTIPGVSAADQLEIVYETSPGPFCGRCETLKISVSPEGRVWTETGKWAGDHKDWHRERLELSVSPEQVRNFRTQLQSLRPDGEMRLVGGESTCESHMTDQPMVRVTWRDSNQTDNLDFDWGCDHDYRRAEREILWRAPEALGLLNPDGRG